MTVFHFGVFENHENYLCKWDVCFNEVNLRGNAFTNDQVALALVYCGMQIIPKYLCLNSGWHSTWAETSPPWEGV